MFKDIENREIDFKIYNRFGRFFVRLYIDGVFRNSELMKELNALEYERAMNRLIEKNRIIRKNNPDDILKFFIYLLDNNIQDVDKETLNALKGMTREEIKDLYHKMSLLQLCIVDYLSPVGPI